MSNRVSYIEIDIARCSLVYGESPCTAAIGTTGEAKCYNSRRTCQDLENYAETFETVRFSVPTHFLNANIDAVPNITNIAYTPSVLSLGNSVGARASITVTFADLLTPDTGPAGDPYIISRDYDPYKRGTYWGKFKARHPYLKGRTLRWYNGKDTDRIEDMEVRTFVVDSAIGPNAKGVFSITAKDPLKLLNEKTAQAPRLSKGVLSAAINSTQTSLTLSPSGIGNQEYPTSGRVSIAGNEIVSFTRSGDNMTITRGQLNTEAQEHDADDRVQLVLSYVGVPPEEIISDLMQNYASIPSEYINLVNWTAETTEYLGRTYTGHIAEPTAVVDLVNEILEQAAISIWWDELGSRIRLQVLRDVTKDSQTITDDLILSESFTQKDQPNKRVSQVWTYYGQINPLESLDDPTNYRNTLSTVNLESETNHGSPSIKQIYSRWIPQFGRTTAERLNNLLLGRYAEPPKLFSYKLLRDSGIINPILGAGYNLQSYMNQGFDGSAVVTPCQTVSVVPEASSFTVQAEEVLISDAVDPINPAVKVVSIDSDTFNFNLRNAFLSIYTEAEEGDTVICEVSEGVVVGSTSTAAYAFDTGDGWPSGIVPQIVIKSGAYIVGRGGDGGSSSLRDNGQAFGTLIYGNFQPGLSGGPSMIARTQVSITNQGVIGGGGGGGGGGASAGFFGYFIIGGGGAAGRNGGLGGQASNTLDSQYNSSTNAAGPQGGLTTGGQYSNFLDFGEGPFLIAQGSKGGDLGQAGGTGPSDASIIPTTGAPGGAPGAAVVGNSLITWDTLGDIRGARI